MSNITIAQGFIMVGFALSALISFYFGIKISLNHFRQIKRDTTFPGTGPALTLFAITLTLLTLMISIPLLTDNKYSSPFDYWFFIAEPTPESNPILSFINTPAMTFLTLSILVWYLGIPSKEQILQFFHSLSNREGRKNLIFAIIIILGAVAGAILFGAQQPYLAYLGALVGGGIIISLVILSSKLFNKPEK